MTPQQRRIVVIGTDGIYGTVDADDLDRGAPVRWTLDSGETVIVPRELFTESIDGSYRVALGKEDLASYAGAEPEAPAEAAYADRTALRSERADFEAARAAEEVVPLVEEELVVGKRAVESGKVRVTTRVHEREEVVDEPLLREEIDVRRVPVGRVIERPLEIRTDGDTTIIPVYEEVLVVEKKLMLKEEIYLTRRQTHHRDAQRVTLRSEEAVVERIRGDHRETL